MARSTAIARERTIQVDIPHCNSVVLRIEDAEQLAAALGVAIAEARAAQPRSEPIPTTCEACKGEGKVL